MGDEVMMNRVNWVLLLVVMGLLVGCGGNRSIVDEAYRPEMARFVDVAEEVGLDFQHDAFRWGVSGDPVAMMGAPVSRRVNPSRTSTAASGTPRSSARTPNRSWFWATRCTS